MKLIPFIASMSIAGLMAGCASEASLRSQARISQAEAEKTALTKVPGASIKETEIEKENGKLVWSVELRTPGATEITEVNVDAVSGAILGVEKEKD